MKSDYDVGSVDDLAVGDHRVVAVNGREIGIFNVRGTLYALPNVCMHQNGPLCRGAVSGTLEALPEKGWELQWTRDGEVVICPWHAMEFDIATGECLGMPGKRLPTYEVRIESGRIKVRL